MKTGNEVMIMVTKPEFLVAKARRHITVVALATMWVAVLALGWLLKYYACVKPAAL